MVKMKTEFKEGDVYGMLVLTGNSFKQMSSDGFRRTYVEAKCQCGITKGYLLKYLLKGETKSCGCNRVKAIAATHVTHNLSNHPLYKVHRDMLHRCYNPKCKSYPDYGERGIQVCKEWQDDVKAFCDWGMANGYAEGLHFDREENEGDYTPANCRFVSRTISNRNTRRNVLITAFGETKCASEWVADKRCSVSWCTLKERIKTGKWKIEDAITISRKDVLKATARNKVTKRMVTAFGETKCMIDWSEDKRCIVSLNALKARIRKGWNAEQAMSTSLLKNKKTVIELARN